jgi:hypothetical protein
VARLEAGPRPRRSRDRAELAAPSLSTSLGNAPRTHGRGQSPVGAPRIHGELLKLGIDVAERTVSRLLPKRLAFAKTSSVRQVIDLSALPGHNRGS